MSLFYPKFNIPGSVLSHLYIDLGLESYLKVIFILGASNENQKK